jgi:hypothetical protein
MPYNLGWRQYKIMRSKKCSIHVADPIDLQGDRKIIVCTLAAVGSPTVINLMHLSSLILLEERFVMRSQIE